MQDVIDRYCDFDRTDSQRRRYTTETRLVRIEEGVAANVPTYLRELGVLDGKLAVFFDENTKRVAGDDVVSALDRAGVAFEAFLLVPSEAEDGVIVCRDSRIDEALALIANKGFVHALGIGAGTMNDVVKMASFRAGIQCSCVGTAPSMNGYTSSIAAILSDGVKTTQPCHAPLAVFADPRVMAEAPYRMIASGIGDLYSKPVSNADWRLSHRLNGSAHSGVVMEIVEAGSKLLEGVAPKLPSRDFAAVGRLTGALMLSGLAMQAGGSSQSASGGEHLVSHFVDMTAYAFDEPHDFHGCQVAVGTIATSALYEHVRALDPSSIDVESLVADHLPWTEYEAVIRQRFGTLSDAVIVHAQKAYPSSQELRRRLDLIKAEWNDIFADAGTTLRGAATLEAELRSAECPTRFEEISVQRDRALRALKWCKDIRNRYTILHLAAELGVLNDWADEYVAASFADA